MPQLLPTQRRPSRYSSRYTVLSLYHPRVIRRLPRCTIFSVAALVIPRLSTTKRDSRNVAPVEIQGKLPLSESAPSGDPKLEFFFGSSRPTFRVDTLPLKNDFRVASKKILFGAKRFFVAAQRIHTDLYNFKEAMGLLRPRMRNTFCSCSIRKLVRGYRTTGRLLSIKPS